MQTKDILYAEGTRVVIAENQSMAEFSGLEPINLSTSNVGTVIKGTIEGYKNCNYTVLLDSGETIEFDTTTSYTDYAESVKISDIESVLEHNESWLKELEKYVDTIKRNLMFLNTTELNKDEIILENQVKLKSKFDEIFQKDKKETERLYRKGMGLKEEVLGCKTKDEAVNLLMGKSLKRYEMVDIGDVMGIDLSEESTKYFMIIKFVDIIFK